jgi:hypothetical protein
MTTPTATTSSSTTSSSTAPLADTSAWAAAAAVRLRYLQANFADDPVESREAFLEDELKKLLDPVPLGKRQAYLDTLAEKFPTWESLSSAPGVAEKAAADSTSPDEIWSLFLKTLPKFSPEQRETIKKRLADAGFVRVSGDSLDSSTTTDITEKLKIPPTDTIDSARLAKLYASLADFAIMTDQLAWNVWKGLAPKSTIRRDGSAGDMRAALRRSTTGDPEVSAAQITAQLERLRQLIAGLIAAIGPAGKNFTRRFQSRYSSEAIRDMVKLEGASVFGNADARNWKKYTDLSQEITEDTIQTDLMDAVVKNAEELMKGQNR